MLYFSRLKIAMIVGVCLLGALLCIPNLAAAPAAWLPWRQVHLGLDLRGGSYLLLEVDMGAVVRERLDSIAESARQTLAQSHIPYQVVASDAAQNRVQIHLRNLAQNASAVAVLKAINNGNGSEPAEFSVETASDNIDLTLSTASLQDRARATIQQSIEIVRRRIDGTGVVDPEIARQGSDQIVVQLPGIEDPNRIKELLGTTAHMTFRLLDNTANMAGPPPPGVDYLPMQSNSNQKLPVRRRVEVDGSDLTDARAGQDPRSGWVVNFSLDSVGARRFADVTRANVGKPFAIVLDNQVVSAPTINEPIIGGQGEITSRFDVRSATDFALLLRAGALPAPLRVVEERTVGPQLGADSIRAGAISLTVGFILVVGFMAAFYGLFGWYANVALIINLILQIGVLSVIQATLTLPGMAGILLTLGMAVDANILINERIREEVRNGRPPLAAMEAGFKRAYATIIDSNVTALLAHVMLFVFGTGPVRGFAVTITVGIVTTLFSAILVARLMMVRWYALVRPQALPV